MAIGQMFTQWKLWFKNKLKPSEWEADTVILWANYLTIKNVTKREFDMAKSLSIDLDFPPNNAKEFLALARKPIEQNYPNIRQAYMNSANENYTHDVVYETAKRVGFWEIKTQAESVTWKAWQQVYPQVCQEHANGAVFKLPVEQQIEHKHIVASQEFVDNLLKNMKKGMAVKTKEEAKAWANQNKVKHSRQNCTAYGAC